MSIYNNGKIYKICCDEIPEVYIGSTTYPLNKRWIAHKSNYNSFQQNEYAHVRSFDILKYPSARIELIELYPCNNKNELLQREGHYIRISNSVNKQETGLTKKESANKWAKNNKEKTKEWRNANHDTLLEDKKEWYELNKERLSAYVDCDCGKKYQVRHKSRHLRTFH